MSCSVVLVFGVVPRPRRRLLNDPNVRKRNKRLGKFIPLFIVHLYACTQWEVQEDCGEENLRREADTEGFARSEKKKRRLCASLSLSIYP